MIIKFLAAIGILTIVVFVGCIMGAIAAMWESEAYKRERWSRSLDEDSRVGKDKD